MTISRAFGATMAGVPPAGASVDDLGTVEGRHLVN